MAKKLSNTLKAMKYLWNINAKIVFSWLKNLVEFEILKFVECYQQSINQKTVLVEINESWHPAHICMATSISTAKIAIIHSRAVPRDQLQSDHPHDDISLQNVSNAMKYLLCNETLNQYYCLAREGLPNKSIDYQVCESKKTSKTKKRWVS